MLCPSASNNKGSELIMRYKNTSIRYSYLHFLSLFILVMLLTSITPAQFDKLIFKKDLSLGIENKKIQALGDQNGDGYDDFLIYVCNTKNSYVFFGGNPIDTIPKFTISGGWISFDLLDINNDGHKDLVFITDESYPNRKIKVYYGGPLLDTIPDLVFSPPPGAMNNFGFNSMVLNDFNGDERSELVIYDPFLPYSTQKFPGVLYFYNTKSTFDTIPQYILMGDSANSIRIYQISSSGDVDGDGKTDFTLFGYQTINGKPNYFRRFYLGNSNFGLTPAVTYYQDEHSFNTEYMHITSDLNKDDKSEIVIEDYGFYPYYYYDAILKGGFPIDTIPKWGLNTQNLGINVEVTELGDVNGDGFPDFIGKAFTPGNYAILKLWLGGRNVHTVSDMTWQGKDCIWSDGGFGLIFGAVGDVNGDGIDDIAIGSVTCVGSLGCTPGTIFIFSGDTSVHADTISAIKNEKTTSPSYYELYDPYPNPFNPETIISYRLAVPGSVSLKIFDILGREIAVLIKEEKSSGKYQFIFNASRYNLPSGLYLLEFLVHQNNNIIYKGSKKLNYLK
jgi:hypothetical protein